MDNIEDRQFKEFLINYLVPFPVILGYAGFRKDDYVYDSKIYCPFHDNTDTPAAKLYKNAQGDSIYCFAEQLIFRPVDVIKKKMFNRSVETIFAGLWKQVDEFNRERIIQAYSRPVSYLPDSWADSKEKLNGFRIGLVSYQTYINNLVNSID